MLVKKNMSVHTKNNNLVQASKIQYRQLFLHFTKYTHQLVLCWKCCKEKKFQFIGIPTLTPVLAVDKEWRSNRFDCTARLKLSLSILLQLQASYSTKYLQFNMKDCTGSDIMIHYVILSENSYVMLQT